MSFELKFPWKATLCLTYICNLKCGFCRIWERRPKGELTFEEWDMILARAPKLRWVDLTGGEPTIRQDFFSIIDSVLRHHSPWMLHFPTNGSLPDRLRGLEQFTKRTRMVVTVSIDGPREVHDRMRGVTGSFDKTIESLRILRATPGIKAVAGMTLSAENETAVADTLSELQNLIPGFQKSDLHINFAQVSEHFYGNSPEGFKEARSIPDARIPLWPLSSFIFGIIERRYRRLLPNFIKTRKSPLPCRSMEASIFISPMGLVHPCITDPRVVGDLRQSDYDLRAILETEESKKVRADIAAGRCPHCWTPCEAYPTIIETMGAGRLLRM